MTELQKNSWNESQSQLAKTNTPEEDNKWAETITRQYYSWQREKLKKKTRAQGYPIVGLGGTSTNILRNDSDTSRYLHMQ